MGAPDSENVIIIGSGPAGYTAALYAARAELAPLVIEGFAWGGLLQQTTDVENYPGFPQGVMGPELMAWMREQAARFGARFITDEATRVELADEPGALHRVWVDEDPHAARAVILAMGAQHRKLDVPGADQFSGAGLYYGAAKTEAMSCAEEEVYLVGGANSAGQAAMHFSRYASKVHMLVRGPSLTRSMSKYLIDQIEATPNIVVETGTEVVAMSGNGRLECLTLKTPPGQEARPANSLFIFIGAAPKTDWLPKEIAVDEKGFILAGPDLKARAPGALKLEREPYLLETSVPVIFVAGDVRFNSVKRCASAVGEGSIAVQFMHQYLATL